MYLINEIDIFDLNSNEKLIVNYLSGAADVIDQKTYHQIINNEFDEMNPEALIAMRERSYIFDCENDYLLFVNSLNRRLLEEEQNQPPIFLLIPTYRCNLNCSYCYEKSYQSEAQPSSFQSKELAEKMIETIDRICSDFSKNSSVSSNNKRTNVTLMGGEPLQKSNMVFLMYLFELLKQHNSSISIISNGYDLDCYLNELTDIHPDFIQITLDGTKSVHDSKRYGIHGEGTYDKIFSNIKLALSKGIDIDIRTNVDCENISNLPELANELAELGKGSEHLHPYIYVLQDEGCNGNKKVIDELSSLKQVIELEKKNPSMAIFRKTFHGVEFIESVFANKQFYFRTSNCAASKNQYILDSEGDIYKCWFGIGNKSYKVGNFIPTLKIDQSQDLSWKSRNIMNLERCNLCKYRYICGGGCASRTSVEPLTGIRREHCANFYEIFSIYFPYLLRKKVEEDN